jgi:hypothetical protein
LGSWLAEDIVYGVVKDYVQGGVGNRWGLNRLAVSIRRVCEFLILSNSIPSHLPFVLFRILHYTLVHASLLICIHSKSITTTTYTHISTGSSSGFFITYYPFYICKNATKEEGRGGQEGYSRQAGK